MLVSNLQARTYCAGQRIDLFWVNSQDLGGPKSLLILRREKNPIFDVTDVFVTVYEEHNITGVSTATVVDAGLKDNTFYYYAVLTSELFVPSLSDYELTNDCRATGFSIEIFDGKSVLWDNTPDFMLEQDLLSVEEGGGGGFLDKWYTIYGCWLSLLHGYAKAQPLLNDVSEAPFFSLTAKLQSLGTDPEGYSYDYEIPRRMFKSLANVYKRRGLCEGLIRAVRMFTKWDAICVDFGLGGENNCLTGGQSLKIWDGVSERKHGGGSFGVAVISLPTTFQDLNQTWADSEWKFGKILTTLGDQICVTDNSAINIASIREPKVVATVTTHVNSGGVIIRLDSIVGLQPGMTVQLTEIGNAHAEIVQIASVSVSNNRITIRYPPLFNSYSAGAVLSEQFSVVRGQIIGFGDLVETSPGVYTLTDATAFWVDGQLIGKVMMTEASASATMTITGNTGTVINATSVAGLGSGTVVYAIASAFIPGASFAARTPILTYDIMNGQHTELFNPMVDLTKSKTLYDQRSYLWQSLGTTLLGSWGSGDVGVYIQGNVVKTIGRMQSPGVVYTTESVLTVDPNVPALVSGALVGSFLNPNQNQNQMYEIIANDATTITVVEDITNLVVGGQAYFVLGKRDANAYDRLCARLNGPEKEFSHDDINVRVLFQ